MITEKMYNILYRKSDISHPLYKDIKIFSLSDLQFPQIKLLEYEFDSRVRIAGIKNKLLLPLSLEEYDSMTNSEQLLKVIESSYFILSRYRAQIENNMDRFNVFADLGDFCFNISEEKIKILSQYGIEDELLSLFNLLKKNGKHRILILGNHDNISYSNYYYKFFDEIKDYGTMFNHYDNTMSLYSHQPLLRTNFNYKTKAITPCNKSLYNNLPTMLENGTFTKGDITQFHGHIHSRKLLEESLYQQLSYENRCIDDIIIKGL